MSLLRRVTALGATGSHFAFQVRKRRIASRRLGAWQMEAACFKQDSRWLTFSLFDTSLSLCAQSPSPAGRGGGRA